MEIKTTDEIKNEHKECFRGKIKECNVKWVRVDDLLAFYNTYPDLSMRYIIKELFKSRDEGVIKPINSDGKPSQDTPCEDKEKITSNKANSTKSSQGFNTLFCVYTLNLHCRCRYLKGHKGKHRCEHGQTWI